MTTYQDIIRMRTAQLIGSGNGTEERRVNRVTGVLLNIVSNPILFTVDYPPSDEVRESLIKRLQNFSWDNGALFQVLSPNADKTFQAAVAKAIAIVKEL